MSFREVRDTDAQGIRTLNDNLRSLWKKVMGTIDVRDLSIAAQREIRSKAAQTQVDALNERVKNVEAAVREPDAGEYVRICRSRAQASEGDMLLENGRLYRWTQGRAGEVCTDEVKNGRIEIANEKIRAGDGAEIRPEGMYAAWLYADHITGPGNAGTCAGGTYTMGADAQDDFDTAGALNRFLRGRIFRGKVHVQIAGGAQFDEVLEVPPCGAGVSIEMTGGALTGGVRVFGGSVEIHGGTLGGTIEVLGGGRITVRETGICATGALVENATAAFEGCTFYAPSNENAWLSVNAGQVYLRGAKGCVGGTFAATDGTGQAWISASLPQTPAGGMSAVSGNIVKSGSIAAVSGTVTAGELPQDVQVTGIWTLDGAGRETYPAASSMTVMTLGVEEDIPFKRAEISVSRQESGSRFPAEVQLWGMRKSNGIWSCVQPFGFAGVLERGECVRIGNAAVQAAVRAAVNGSMQGIGFGSAEVIGISVDGVRLWPAGEVE